MRKVFNIYNFMVIGYLKNVLLLYDRVVYKRFLVLKDKILWKKWSGNISLRSKRKDGKFLVVGEEFVNGFNVYKFL